MDHRIVGDFVPWASIGFGLIQEIRPKGFEDVADLLDHLPFTVARARTRHGRLSGIFLLYGFWCWPHSEEASDSSPAS
jgi:hypothetical protein